MVKYTWGDRMKRAIIFLLIFTFLPLGVFAFSDVSGGDWFYQNVEDMTDQGYLQGYDDGTFRPYGAITKAEFVAIVSRLCNLAPASGDTKHWASGLMQSALSNGYYDWDEIPPTGDSYDEPINRQLAFKIVMKALLPQATGKYEDISKAPDFNELDGRYYDSVMAAVANGIVVGDDTGRLQPKDNLTRAEACAIIMRAGNKNGSLSPYAAPKPTDTPVPISRSGGVSENGKLCVIGKQLCNESKKPIVLHGMSSHGLHWFSQFVTKSAIKSTADYGANLFRLAMYTGEGGYLTNKSVKNTLINAVDFAISLDMYVIIDWHILSDNDPLQNVDEAESFFRDISKRYANYPNVLYEICNEPNGNITWSGNVKPYAERIIKAIRENSDGVILVGSPTWSQDLHQVKKDPINQSNIMYTCHFYAGTHKDFLRQRISDCQLPVFVSEWGTSAADGNGGVYLDEAQIWIDFMNENNISWANWSLCDKNESSAALKSGADISDGISENELSQSGLFVFSKF